ncbi:extracellular solute-binding protein [Actinomadura litoris]|uniref:extracellular solute-binding protein n=1 Tax=Actinomadura litoris TaxID=2678616 RepID=UPI001FA73EC6|nr:extracellular solute-binding protein [Actinomadura litoris]
MVERIGRRPGRVMRAERIARRRAIPPDRHAPPDRRMRRSLPALRAAVALTLLTGGLAACSGGGGGTPTLNWYINPDDGGQAKLAASCTKASGGKYKIKTSVLPNDATQQREQLVRRLAAKDSGLDIMSLDPVFVAEVANAGWLRPFTAAESKQFTDGVFPAAVQSSTWEGKLYAAPFWANTQLLWYRKSAARKAGVDPNAPDFTWDKMIDAAVRSNTTVAAQGNRYEGYMVWINALIASAGGRIISDAEKGAEATIEIDSPAGRQAATIIRKLARSKAASPTLSTDIEEQARSVLNGSRGGFMVNWGYIWRAENGDAKAGVIDKNIPADLGWARYPKVSANQDSKPPFGGIELGIGGYGKYRDTLAVDAVRCITTPENMKQYMIVTGNPAARAVVYDDPQIKKEFPMAGLIRDSINAASPRPITPYYGDVSGAVQSRWHPPASVDPNSTPRRSETFIRQVLRDQALL